MIKIEAIEHGAERGTHFVFTADEPARIEVTLAPGGVLADAYRGTAPDSEQEPDLVFDGTIGRNFTVWSDRPGHHDCTNPTQGRS